ncbi:MAG TPA: DUF3631 domain-containing protein [Chakrabartia sp.]|jgi:uncharacterized protein (DUF2267 family)|nr:DUF3631 domain-containing protein [Chakrabartia sp.]
MSAILSERAGAAPTATGPEDAKVEAPASSLSPIPPISPDMNDGGGSGAGLLDRIHAYACRFIAYPSYLDGIAHVLWITHTHMMDAWLTTPRLAVLSPEPGSGKTRVLEITGMLVPNPLLSAQSTASAILRTIAVQYNRPTVLLDEIDAIFGPAARGNEELRSMVNSGYRKGAVSVRCYMDKGKVLIERLATYAAIALGGLGNLPDTIMTRSVVIPMRKRLEGEKAEPFRPRLHEPIANVLCDELAAWAASVAEEARLAEPVLPQGIADRSADIWEPLLVVADLAGGRWPDLARQAAVAAVQSAKASSELPLGVQLLADIRHCFGCKDKLPTRELLELLLAEDESPWGDIGYRKKLDAHLLAKMLRPYGIGSSSIRLPDGSTPKGYKRADFHDAWERYLTKPATGATSATSEDSPEI